MKVRIGGFALFLIAFVHSKNVAAIDCKVSYLDENMDIRYDTVRDASLIDRVSSNFIRFYVRVRKQEHGWVIQVEDLWGAENDDVEQAREEYNAARACVHRALKSYANRFNLDLRGPGGFGYVEKFVNSSILCGGNNDGDTCHVVGRADKVEEILYEPFEEVHWYFVPKGTPLGNPYPKEKACKIIFEMIQDFSTLDVASPRYNNPRDSLFSSGDIYHYRRVKDRLPELSNFSNDTVLEWKAKMFFEWLDTIQSKDQGDNLVATTDVFKARDKLNCVENLHEGDSDVETTLETDRTYTPPEGQ